MSDPTINTLYESEPDTEAHAMLEAAAALLSSETYPVPAEIADQVTVVEMPNARHVETIDVERLMSQPRRQKGTTALHGPDSLVVWVQGQAGTDGGVAVYGDLYSTTITAVINPGTADYPGWDDHRGALTLKRHPRWDRWRAIDGKVIGQAQFAGHVQLCASDFVAPAAADVLEIAETLTLNVGAKVSSAQRMRDGQRRIIFDETVDATAGGDLAVEIPETITLRFPLFDGAEPEEITARLMYRKVDGGVGFAVQFVDPDEKERTTFATLTNQVAEALDVTALMGHP
jgi:uncharacterized protein YfdQ (DUF2303 family)